MNAFLGNIRNFWFTPSTPTNLSIFRILFFFFLAIANFRIEHFLNLPEYLRQPPRGYELFFQWIPFDVSTGLLILAIFKIACWMSCVGVLTRLSTLIAAFSGLYVLGMQSFFGKIIHTHHIIIGFIFILAASNCGDMFSVDSFIKRRFMSQEKRQQSYAPSLSYSLPLCLMWVFFSVSYFFPGFWKLQCCGLGWAFGDNVQNILHHLWFRRDFVPLFRIDHYPHFLKLMGLLTIIFEIGLIFFIFIKRYHWIIILAAIGFHSANDYFLKINFSIMYPCLLVFVDWEGVIGFIKRNFLKFSLSVDESIDLQRGYKRVLFVGSVFIFTTVYCGVRLFDSWPMGVMPTFSKYFKDTGKSVEMHIHYRSHDEPRVLDHREMIEKIDQLSLKNVMSIAREKNPEVLNKWVDRVLEASNDSGLIDFNVHKIELYLTEVWVNPDKWAMNPRSRKSLGEVIINEEGISN